MEGLWILLGTAISAASGVIFWFLNSKTAKDVQERQQSHELQMHEQRLQAERQSKHDEAIRTMRRARLEPVFDLFAELDGWLSHCMWRGIAQQMEQSGAIGNLAHDMFPEMAPDLLSKVVRYAKEGLEQEIQRPPATSLARWMSSLPRIGDEGLRQEIALLITRMAAPDSDPAELASRMADMHARLERYAAAVDS